MSLHYILDGYNIVKQLPQFANCKLEEGRERLIKYLEEERPQGSLNNEVLLVFDGQAGVYHSHRSSLVRIIFSENDSADERIKDFVEQSENKRTVIVVTDDKEIQYFVAAYGARFLKVNEFMKVDVDRVAIGNDGLADPVKHVSRSLEAKINAELEEIWLKRPRKIRT